MARLVWYFDFVSPFAYLQFAGHPGIFQRPDVDMKPVLFAGLLKHFEHKGPAEIEPKRIHTYRHTQWQADKYGIADEVSARAPVQFAARAAPRDRLRRHLRYGQDDLRLHLGPGPLAERRVEGAVRYASACPGRRCSPRARP